MQLNSNPKKSKLDHAPSNITFLISFEIGITISEDEQDSDSGICLKRNFTPIVIDLDSESENEPINEQEILKGLQEKIEKRYLNDSKIFIHNSDHNHDHLRSNDEDFEFEYICQIPFGNQVDSQKSNFSILQRLPEVPVAQEKLLEDRIYRLLSKYNSKELSIGKTVKEIVCKDSMLSRPLKKRRIKF